VSQPRDPRGRFACVISYPRLRTSRCGCGGGGSHPCPVGKRLRGIREAARRAFVPLPYTDEDVEEIERDLYGIEQEGEALRQALDWTSAQIEAKGSKSHRSRLARLEHARQGGFTARDVYGEESERGYEELLEERRRIRAHADHLRRETARLSGELLKARRQLGGTISRSLLRRAARAGVARRRPVPLHAHHH